MDDTSIVDQLASFLNDYPALWMLYGFILFVPVVLFITIFCWPKRLDPVAQRKKTDAPSPDDSEEKHQLDTPGGVGGEKDKSKSIIEAKNASFENSSEHEPPQYTPPSTDDDRSESHDQIPDDRIPEETPVINSLPQEETPDLEIPQEEETPVVNDIPQETPEIEIPKEEPPVITEPPQEEIPEFEIPQQETVVINDIPQETPEFEIPKEEETPVITEPPQEETPEIEGVEEETPVIKTAQVEDELELSKEDVPVINGHHDEVPEINQEKTVNGDAPELNDANELTQELHYETEDNKALAHGDAPALISDSHEESFVMINGEDAINGNETESGDLPTIKVINDLNEQTFEQNGHLEEAEQEEVVNGDSSVTVNGHDDSPLLTNGVEGPETAATTGDESEEALPPPAVEVLHENGVHEEEEGEGERERWRFPPVLEDFDLMETEADPDELESMFHDERLIEIYLDIKEDGPGLGISIVGGNGSPSGDLPIIIKRVLPDCLAAQDGRLKQGDELVAINEKLLVGVSKDYAIDALSNNDGVVRLLVLQDD